MPNLFGMRVLPLKGDARRHLAGQFDSERPTRAKNYLSGKSPVASQVKGVKKRGRRKKGGRKGRKGRKGRRGKKKRKGKKGGKRGRGGKSAQMVKFLRKGQMQVIMPKSGKKKTFSFRKLIKSIPKEKIRVLVSKHLRK